jgi:hypothetical protein
MLQGLQQVILQVRGRLKAHGKPDQNAGLQMTWPA